MATSRSKSKRAACARCQSIFLRPPHRRPCGSSCASTTTSARCASSWQDLAPREIRVNRRADGRTTAQARCAPSQEAVMRLLALAAVVACGTGSKTPNGPAYVAGGVDVNVQVDVDGNFAAMQEVPVGGGELRLVAPRQSHDDAGAVRPGDAVPPPPPPPRAEVAGP